MATDTLYPIAAEKLFAAVLSSLEKGNIFGIYRELWYEPREKKGRRTTVFGKALESPLGLAAGPHTQMAPNILAGWLCGARYIELKTVQTLDDIEVPKPCIDIGDEGYNCEWSQELSIRQSFEEYLKAWILVHVLHHARGFPGEDPGTVFNMSVGYDMKGILRKNVQGFFEKMRDCSREKAEMIDIIRPLYPAVDEIPIPDTISDNVTLSTMHGCPAEEIGTIGEYLIKEKKLHTFIKLNPTLLGEKDIRDILHSLGYETRVPDAAFEHDIDLASAEQLIRRLQDVAGMERKTFGIKLTNTLESRNHKDIFDADSMYMSGKALHPLSINTAAKLRKAFPDLPLSFCGGVNADNIADVLKCGLHPVTVCSDILRPGGYTKLLQYTERVPAKKSRGDAAAYLRHYAEQVRKDPRYAHEEKSIKTDRELTAFDCIAAPCIDACPAHQDIPRYIARIAAGGDRKALETVLRSNPFPSATGMICDHPCQSKCTRINYDSALRIRDIKRYIAGNTPPAAPAGAETAGGTRVAVIGGGPSGLSCAYYLALAGCRADVYEEKEVPGGMPAATIPGFRLSPEALERDIAGIKRAGVNILTGRRIGRKEFRELRKDYDFIYIAVGAQKALKVRIPGEEGCSGILDPLETLAALRRGESPDTGKNIRVLGGGNTAVDVARSVRRSAGAESRVSIVYRRTRKEMPADEAEVRAALEEGVELIELAAPARIVSRGGKLTSLECRRMQLVPAENGGRPRPVPVPGDTFPLPADSVIPAFGQETDVDFYGDDIKKLNGDYREQKGKVFIGGDAKHGASFLIRSIADGKEVAEEILRRSGAGPAQGRTNRHGTDRREHHRKLSQVLPRVETRCVEPGKRTLDRPVELPMEREEVEREASRCLDCDEICDICVTVCPNRANLAWKTVPVAHRVFTVAFEGRDYALQAEADLVIEQEYQVLNISDLCNECGNCTTFCPSAGRPFVDKPRIALTEESFRTLDRVFRIRPGEAMYKEGEKTYVLTRTSRGWDFRSGGANVSLNARFDVVAAERGPAGNNTLSLRNAVRMRIIGEALRSQYPELLK